MADKKRVKAMEAAVEEKRKAYDAAAETAAKVESKVQKVHNKIMELTEGKMNKAREKLDAITNQIGKVSLQKNKNLIVNLSHNFLYYYFFLPVLVTIGE